MRPPVILATLVLVVVVLVLPAPLFAQAKGPADFAFDKGKDSPGAVSFSHEGHRQKTEKCTACHTRIFKMKKGETGVLAMDKMKAGEQCGSCHNGKTQMAGKAVFDVGDKASCARCHRKG
jgi:c(7)-type cytochrome triheme protein